MDGKTNSKDCAIPKGVFGILAFFLGALGVHDFATRRYLYGCYHLALTILGIVVFRSSQSSFLPPTLILGSWAWAIAENITYQKSTDVVVTKNGLMRSFSVTSIVAEVATGLTILLSILATVINIQGRDCYASGCSAPGWAIVFEIWIGLPVVFVTIFLVSVALAQRKNLPTAYKHNGKVLYHTIASGVLGIISITAIILMLLATARVI